MAAYASLVTLSKAIHQLLPFEQHYSFLCDTHKMQSLLDKVNSFQEFLEHISGKSSDGIDELESRIRDVAHRLEDIIESMLVYSLAVEYENEVNSRLSIQDANSELISSIEEANTQLQLAAEGTVTSRKSFFRGLAKKLSRKSEAKASLDDILGWCLHHDFKQKAKYMFLPLTKRVAAAFGNSVKRADLLLKEAMEMKKNLEDKVVISGTSIVPHDIATTSLSRGPPDSNDTVVGLKDGLNQILEQIRSDQRALEVIPITGMGGIGKTTLARAVYDHHIKQHHFDLVLWATVSQQYNLEEILRVLCPEITGSDAIVSVHQRLYGRRYLIILDDVWDEKVWDGVRNAFPNDNNCSRVILTTRLANVATYVSSSSTCAHQMQLLSEEQSWDLLRETVYGHEIGCPSKCFLYFGMFPEDKKIPTKELVRIWCAEGFLKPRESKTMEEVAEECLEELVERNLVLVIKKSWYDGKIKTSSIHDVLRDLCLTQAGKEKFLYRHGSSRIKTFLSIIKDQPRRVVSFPPFFGCIISYNSPIRTFRTHKRSGMIPQFKLVRVLGTLKFSSAALRNSVRLNNLRYLHLHREWGDKESIMVPKSISKLRNLETLFLSCRGYYSQLILPVEIWEMPRLRHLVSEFVYMKLPPFPASDDSSRESLSLQTLTGLLNFRDFSPRVIQKLQQNLKKLQISYTKISDGDEVKVFGVENLVNLHHLEHLTILSYDYYGPILRNIGFPMNLKKLRLTRTELPWEKMTSIGDLIHLQVLKLGWNAFVGGDVWEPIEGGFPQLKYLKMKSLYSLEEWRAESTHFPSLEKLLILECMSLKEVPAEIGEIDTLEKLIVKKFKDDSVGRGFEESVRRIEEEQQRVGNYSLQVIIMSEDQELRDVDR